MMVPKKSLVFAGAALLCLGSASSAQDSDSPMHRRVTEPLRPVQLDLQTGTVTRGPAVQQRGAPGFTTCSTLNNLDHSGFVGVDSGPGTPNGPCEWIDEYSNNLGDGAQAKSGFVTSFAFAYCSSALDPRSGGSGGAARIGFRAGYVKGSGNNVGSVSGTDVGSFNLTGLPANTACSSFFGGFNCYLININLGSVPVVLPSGTVGWSWRFGDLGTDGVLAKTFPFISCVQSCTGSGPDNSGAMTDTIDQYCPAGQALSTFTFGTSPSGAYYTSLSIDLREAEAIAPSVTSNNGNGLNNRGLIGAPATFGGTFAVTANCTLADPAKLAIFRVAFAPNPAPIPYKGGEVLVAITAGTGVNIFQAHGGGLATPVLPLPPDLTFYGSCWNVQAFCGDTGAGGAQNQLTNRITQTFGN